MRCPRRLTFLDDSRYDRFSHASRTYSIYKYSDEHYDEEEWFFPGNEHVDGTLEGAMKAGLEAYPA